MRNKIHTAEPSLGLAVHWHHSTRSLMRSAGRSMAATYKVSLLVATGILTIVVCIGIGIIKLSLKLVALPAMLVVGAGFLLYQYLNKRSR